MGKILERGMINKFGEEITGKTIAWSSWWNIVKVDAPKLNQKFVGKSITWKLKNGKEQTNKIVGIGRMEYSSYLYLEVAPNDDELKAHEKYKKETKKDHLKERGPRFMPLTNNNALYAYLKLENNVDLMDHQDCFKKIGEKIYR